jgi:hypothetical protein
MTQLILDEMVDAAVADCGVLARDADALRTAERFACLCGEWPIRFRDLVLAVAVASARLLHAKMERGAGYESARRDADNWKELVLRALVTEGKRHIDRVLRNASAVQ